MNFSELGLDAHLVSRLDGLGLKDPTPIQAKAIPLASMSAAELEEAIDQFPPIQAVEMIPHKTLALRNRTLAILAVFAASWLAYANAGYLFDPVYPALAILAAIVIDRVRILLSGYFAKPIYGGLLIVGLMALSAFWSVPMAYENMIHERFLLLKPF